jgi:hypothetical protein
MEKLQKTLRRSNLNSNLRKSIAVRSRNSDAAVALVLSVVDSILRRPSLVVETAVQLISNTILALHPRVEEAASLEGTITGRVALVVGSLRSAGGSANTGVVYGILVEGLDANAHVGVVAVAVQRCVDGATQLGRTVVSGKSGGSGNLVVGVRASNDYLKLVAPLAKVLGLRGRHTSAPESALVVGE